jgi:hypothetical protein
MLALVAACSSDEGAVVTAPGTYMAPVADYDANVDAMMWDTALYDPIVIGIVVAQVTPSDSGIADASEVIDAGVPAVTKTIPRPLGALLASWGARVTADCVPVVAFTDADLDGIPLIYSATYNCSNLISAGRTTTVTGNVIITDADDNNPLGGMAILFNNFVVNTAIINGDTRSRTLNGSISMLPSGGTYVSSRNLSLAFDFVDKNGNRAQGTHVMAEQATYTPDAGLTNPFASGTVNLTGQGTLSRTFQGVNESRIVTRATNPLLHWNRSCRAQDPTNSGFDAGTLIYTDDKGGTFRLAFSGCGAPTATNF